MFGQLSELPNLPNTGRQIGDITVLRTEVSVHLPDCVAQRFVNGRIVACTCLVKLANLVPVRSGLDY